MINRIIDSRFQRRSKRVAEFIRPHVSESNSVLDLGCGDLLIGQVVQQTTGADVTGLDVIDTNQTKLPLMLFDGKEIPFADKSFDVTYASFVLHHTDNARELLSECARVTRKKIVILEDVYKNNVGLLVAKVLDLTNKFAYPNMRFPLNFMKEEQWIDLFRALDVKNVRVTKIRPDFFLGRHRLFVLNLTN